MEKTRKHRNQLYVTLLVLSSWGLCLVVVNLALHSLSFPQALATLGIAAAVFAGGILALLRAGAQIRRRGRYLAAGVVLFSAMAVLLPALVLSPVQTVLGKIHFAFLKHQFSTKAAMASKTGAPQFLVFEWGTSPSQSVLVFDETDELHDPHRVKSPGWWVRARAADGELASCLWWDRPLSGHYYLVTKYCVEPYRGSPISQ